MHRSEGATALLGTHGFVSARRTGLLHEDGLAASVRGHSLRARRRAIMRRDDFDLVVDVGVEGLDQVEGARYAVDESGVGASVGERSCIGTCAYGRRI